MKEIKVSLNTKYIDYLHKESLRIHKEYGENKHPSLIEIMQSENPDKELLFELEVIRIAKVRLTETANDCLDEKPTPNSPA